MKVSDFDYVLPKEFISQYPAEMRDESKLLVLHRDTGKIEHKSFKDIVNYFSAGDVLIVNKTKVIPARLFGKKVTGGKIEILILGYGDNKIVPAIVSPLKNLKPTTRIFFDKDFCEVVGIEDGIVKLKFSENINLILEKHGRIPLPPYIKRDLVQSDIERYQTVFAAVSGSIAAPTAGLHFTKEILELLEHKNVKVAEVLLHISLATFSKVKSENITQHKMGEEYFEIEKLSADIINLAKRKIAVGTSSVRVLETVSDGKNVLANRGTTNLFIYPGYKFKNTDAVITNFHLPKTTLLMLVCAFAGRDLIFNAYEEAKQKNYRFASYGDAMLIL
ncbi:MAG: tRNA preQ1(34) S-adenosylmethionine ribosyltransferase-isomerase QueA [Elusimicrobiota bacterium]